MIIAGQILVLKYIYLCLYLRLHAKSWQNDAVITKNIEGLNENIVCVKTQILLEYK